MPVLPGKSGRRRPAPAIIEVLAFRLQDAAVAASGRPGRCGLLRLRQSDPDDLRAGAVLGPGCRARPPAGAPGTVEETSQSGFLRFLVAAAWQVCMLPRGQCRRSLAMMHENASVYLIQQSLLLILRLGCALVKFRRNANGMKLALENESILERVSMLPDWR